MRLSLNKNINFVPTVLKKGAIFERNLAFNKIKNIQASCTFCCTSNEEKQRYEEQKIHNILITITL